MLGGMSPASFAGPVAEHYAKFRRGYSADVVDHVVVALGLDGRSRVLDIGCGTGQLTLPLARRTRGVLGVDVEPDMLRLAREAGIASGVTNAGWLLSADSDLDGLVPLLGERSFDAVTIGQALHWMDPPRLFSTLRRLLRPAGTVGVIANGTPLWLQDTVWSQALRAHLESWLGVELTAWCGTDPATRREYAAQLADAGFADVAETVVEYVDQLTFEQVAGNVYSAMSPEQLPHGPDREIFEQRLREALAGASAADPYVEPVAVRVLAGRGIQDDHRVTAAVRAPSR
jgi:ubiquinone/menaquinone biosynthesis C-methylase UbiE